MTVKLKEGTNEGKTIRTMLRVYKRETVQIISTQYYNVSYHAGTTSDDSY